ncbi:MAG: hypothetical protein IJX81_02940 [Clostridia bacterium]|nr:hypothetical protein [Clostridia bacterium]
MKTMKTTLNKFFITMLSFAMLLVCAFTFPARKASADVNEDFPTIPDDVITAYTEDAVGDLQFTEGGDPICFLLDDLLFTKAETPFAITANTTLSNINNSAVIQAMAKDFAEKLGISVPEVRTIIDAATVFNQINMDIIIHFGENTYINVITGATSNQISNYSRLSNWNGYVTSSTAIYAMVVFQNSVEDFYSLLLNVQRNHTGYMQVDGLSYNSIMNPGSLAATVHYY